MYVLHRLQIQNFAVDFQNRLFCLFNILSLFLHHAEYFFGMSSGLIVYMNSYAKFVNHALCFSLFGFLFSEATKAKKKIHALLGFPTLYTFFCILNYCPIFLFSFQKALNSFLPPVCAAPKALVANATNPE